MLSFDEMHFERTDRAGAAGGSGFLFFRPAESKKTLPFDELRWPYRFSPIQAYLCGVVTIWSLFVVYHVVAFAITANKRSWRGRGGNRKNKRAKKQSSRPCAPVAKVPPKSPVPLYQPNKVSLHKVQSKLAKKMARRSAARKQRKSKREFTRFKQKKATKTTMLPTSEVKQHHMTSKSLEKPFAFVSSGAEINDVPLRSEVVNDETIDDALPTPASESSHAVETKIVTLISSGVYEYTQKAQINETLALFNDLQITHEIIDGNDPLQRDIRNHLFRVSGIRGCYPQIFCSSGAGGNDYKYLGGYDWLQSTPFEDLRSIMNV